MNAPLIELKQINFSTSEFAVNNINLTLNPGEIHIIMGENGSGKSLLMQLINGSISNYSGEIFYQGEYIKPKAYVSLIEDKIIYIRQDLTLLDNLSIAENLYFHQLPYKNKFLKEVDYEKLNYQYKQLIEDLNLPLTMSDTVKTIGLAQRQIIEFCKAYISNANIVILDDPSAALSPKERNLLYSIVQSIRSRGTGIFFITHHIDDVLAIGDRISIMKKGTILATKNVANTTEEEIIHLLSNNYIKDRYPKMHYKKGKLVLSVKQLGFENKLNNISFDLHEGEILGITGMAGSGRTLLANCLFGVTKYDGQIYIQGELVNIDSPEIAIHNGIALLPENRIDESIFEALDTNENVAFPSLKRFSKNQIINMDYLKQAVHDYIVKINIPTHNIENIMSYSGGSMQKAIFAKWMMSRAKIFILDEPTRGIDIASKIDIYNFINDLKKKKVCIVYISSDIEEIFGVCDRVAVLSDNTFACDVPIEAITLEDIVKLATSGKH